MCLAPWAPRQRRLPGRQLDVDVGAGWGTQGPRVEREAGRRSWPPQLPRLLTRHPPPSPGTPATPPPSSRSSRWAGSPSPPPASWLVDWSEAALPTSVGLKVEPRSFASCDWSPWGTWPAMGSHRARDHRFLCLHWPTWGTWPVVPLPVFIGSQGARGQRDQHPPRPAPEPAPGGSARPRGRGPVLLGPLGSWGRQALGPVAALVQASRPGGASFAGCARGEQGRGPQPRWRARPLDARRVLVTSVSPVFRHFSTQSLAGKAGGLSPRGRSCGPRSGSRERRAEGKPGMEVSHPRHLFLGVSLRTQPGRLRPPSNTSPWCWRFPLTGAAQPGGGVHPWCVASKWQARQARERPGGC